MAKTKAAEIDEQLLVWDEPEGGLLATVRIVVLLVRGVWPLLMHNPIGMGMDSGGAGLKEKKIPTPDEEAAAGRYVTEDGLLYVPAQAIRNSIASGGKGRRANTKQAATSALRAGMFPAEERCILLDSKTGKPKGQDDYEIDTRRVQLKGSMGRAVGVMRSRALVRDWMFKVPLELDALVTDELVVDAGNVAGRMVGLLDYRPEKSGPFGRYTIQQIDPKPKKKAA